MSLTTRRIRSLFPALALALSVASAPSFAQHGHAVGEHANHGSHGSHAAAAPGAERTVGNFPVVEVFKSPYCGCCGAWVEHMEHAGFTVKVTPVEDVNASRAQLGMPATYGSCHTAKVGGYLLEGHVPAQDVKKLLADKPAAVGLAVPGMPLGSPGMEAGGRQDAYDVLLVKEDGKASTFTQYPKR